MDEKDLVEAIAQGIAKEDEEGWELVCRGVPSAADEYRDDARAALQAIEKAGGPSQAQIEAMIAGVADIAPVGITLGAGKRFGPEEALQWSASRHLPRFAAHKDGNDG